MKFLHTMLRVKDIQKSLTEIKQKMLTNSDNSNDIENLKNFSINL